MTYNFHIPSFKVSTQKKKEIKFTESVIPAAIPKLIEPANAPNAILRVLLASAR